MLNRLWTRACVFWGRKGAAFLVVVAALVTVALINPEAAEAVGMWLCGTFGVLAGADAAITVGSRPKKPAPGAPTDVAPDAPVEQPPPGGR